MGKRGKKNGNYQKVTRVLPVKLSDKEIQAAGEKLAELELDLQRAKEEAAGIAAQFRERKKALAENIAKTSRVVDEGQEDRPIVCEMVPDYRRNVMEVVRTDTDEVVEDRALTVDERQMELGGKPKGAEAQDADPVAETIEEEPPLAPKKTRARRKHDDQPNGVSTEASE